MIRPAAPADRPALEAFLQRNVECAMFPLTNLRAHGLGDGDFPSDHPHAMRVWIIGPGLRAIVGLTRQGMLMPLLPDPGDLRGLPARVAACSITGAGGPAAQVRLLLDALGLAAGPTLRDEDEPGFALDLATLRVPSLAGARLVAPTAHDRDLLIRWRTAYHREVLGTPADQAEARAVADTDGDLARDSHRILTVNGQPVATTGFNAVLPDIVQIGGVYTPPGQRNRGYARQAVALHLAEARTKGATRAILFAAGEAAVRAYRAIGFQPVQSVGLVLFDGPQKVMPCP